MRLCGGFCCFPVSWACNLQCFRSHWTSTKTPRKRAGRGRAASCGARGPRAALLAGPQARWTSLLKGLRNPSPPLPVFGPHGNPSLLGARAPLPPPPPWLGAGHRSHSRAPGRGGTVEKSARPGREPSGEGFLPLPEEDPATEMAPGGLRVGAGVRSCSGCEDGQVPPCWQRVLPVLGEEGVSLALPGPAAPTRFAPLSLQTTLMLPRWWVRQAHPTRSVQAGVPPAPGAHVECGPFLTEANPGGSLAKLLSPVLGGLTWLPKSSVLSSPPPHEPLRTAAPAAVPAWPGLWGERRSLGNLEFVSQGTGCVRMPWVDVSWCGPQPRVALRVG